MAEVVPDDLLRELEVLVRRMRDRDVAPEVEAMLEALITRGVLPASFRRQMARVQAEPRKVHLAIVPEDKYVTVNADVDCMAIMPICGARCCKLVVTLAEQDVVEGKLPFVVDEPYLLPKNPETKRCICQNADGGCGVYEIRPGPCRAFDCREDRRIWVDFEAKILAPTS